MATLDELKLKIEDAKRLLEAEEERNSSLAKKIDLLKEERSEMERGKSEYKAATENLAKLREEQELATDAIKRQTAALDAQNKAYEENEKVSTRTKDSLEKLTQGFFSLETSLGKMAKGWSQGDLSLTKFAKSGLIGKYALGQLAAAGAKATDIFVKFGIQQDEMLAKFRAQTGAGDEFNEVIRDVALSNLQAGVTLQESADSVARLKNEYTDFTYASEDQQKTLAANTTLLNKIGMSFNTQAKIMQTATQAMGMSADESQVLLRDLASTAKSLGVDIETLGAQFEANKDFIVRFGEDGQEVFEELSVAAKALGADLGTLIEVTEKFKTFDSAAQSVGRLNAILGGPFLNSIDMLNASYEDPIEGIKMLRDGFDQAGVSVEDLSGAELEAFASALGLSVSKTKELLGKSNEDLEIQRMNQEELAETAQKAQSAMEQLTNAFRQLLADGKPLIDNIIVPMIEGIGALAKFLGDADNGLAKFVRTGLAIAGVAALFMKLAPLAAIIAAPFTGGASLALLAGIGAIGGGIAVASGIGTTAQSSAMAGFADGGVVQGTSMAMVGERGPEMVEMPVGTRVTTAPKTEQLTNAITKLISKLDNTEGGSQKIAVYIGQEKVDEIVVKAINSTAGRNAFSPFTNG
tara:strand:- start:4433 stop:6343 length:1911 start_codon:yes stop_codon:yes gene_type:complete